MAKDGAYATLVQKQLVEAGKKKATTKMTSIGEEGSALIAGTLHASSRSRDGGRKPGSTSSYGSTGSFESDESQHQPRQRQAKSALSLLTRRRARRYRRPGVACASVT